MNSKLVTANFLALCMFAVSPLRAQQGAGPLDPPADPADGVYRTLEEIYDALRVADEKIASMQSQLARQNGLITSLMSSLVPGLPFLYRVATEDDLGEFSSHAYSPTGRPAIAFYNGTAGDLEYAEFDGAMWQTATVDSVGDVGKQPSLAFSPSGHPAISYFDATNGQVIFAQFDGVDWSRETVDTTGQIGHPSLDFAPNGEPAVGYLEIIGDPPTVRFAQREGTVWQHSTVEPTNGGGTPSLKFSPLGHPTMAYGLGSQPLRFAELVGTSWQVVEVQTGGLAAAASLAYSPDGYPAVSYHDPYFQIFGTSHRDLRIARFNGSSWDVEVVDSTPGSGLQSSLAFSPSGLPTIAYLDLANANLKIAQPDGLSWRLTPVDATGEVGEGASLAFSPEGQPSVSYYDRTNGDLKFASQLPLP